MDRVDSLVTPASRVLVHLVSLALVLHQASADIHRQSLVLQVSLVTPASQELVHLVSQALALHLVSQALALHLVSLDSHLLLQVLLDLS